MSKYSSHFSCLCLHRLPLATVQHITALRPLAQAACTITLFSKENQTRLKEIGFLWSHGNHPPIYCSVQSNTRLLLRFLQPVWDSYIPAFVLHLRCSPG